MSRPTASAAQLLATHREVWWEFDVLTTEVRCDCRRDLKAGEPIVSRVRRRRGPKPSKYDGIAVGDIMCVPCGIKAVQEWARIAADLEWRAERDALASPRVAEVLKQAQEMMRRATEQHLGPPMIDGVEVKPGEVVVIDVPIVFESTTTLNEGAPAAVTTTDPIDEWIRGLPSNLSLACFEKAMAELCRLRPDIALEWQAEDFFLRIKAPELSARDSARIQHAIRERIPAVCCVTVGGAL